MDTRNDEEDPFYSADRRGREKVVGMMENYYTQFNYETMPPKCTYDISVTADTKEMIWECKDRHYNSTDFRQWMLEEHKFNDLKRQGKEAYYVNTFKDDRIVLWNITKLPDDYPTVWKKAPRYTVTDSEELMKPYKMLTLEQAELILTPKDILQQDIRRDNQRKLEDIYYN